MLRADVAGFIRAAVERRRALARAALESLRARVPLAAAPPGRSTRGPAAEPRAFAPPSVPVVRDPPPVRSAPAPPATATEAATLRRLLSDPASLGAAFAVAEILGKPVALRDP